MVRAFRRCVLLRRSAYFRSLFLGAAMKIRNSIRSLKTRDKDCRVVRRRGRVYIINKTKRRYKARQG